MTTVRALITLVTLSLLLLPSGEKGGMRGTADAADWVVRFEVSTPSGGADGGKARVGLTAGTDPTATAGFDGVWDTTAFSNAVLTATFPTVAGTPSTASGLWRDLRSMADLPANWDVTVSSNLTNPVISLTWTVSQAEPCQAWTLSLTDQSGPTTLDWASGAFSFTYTAARTFRLSAATGATETPPLAPTGLWSPLSGAGGVVLAWTPVTTGGVTGYDVFRRRAGEALSTRLTASPTAQPAYVDKTVAAGTTYVYVVRAVSASRCASAASADVTVAVP